MATVFLHPEKPDYWSHPSHMNSGLFLSEHICACKNDFQGIRHEHCLQMLLSYHRFSDAVMRVDSRSSRQRENTDTDFIIAQSYIPSNTVSQCNLKCSPHHHATKRENNSYPDFIHIWWLQLEARLIQASRGFYQLRRIKAQESPRGPATRFSIGPG